MSDWALVIGVEHYPDMTGPNASLTGSTDGALAMLEAFKRLGVPDANAIIHISKQGAQPEGTLPATRAAIRASLKRLHEQGKDTTRRLYVFYSGHGLSYGGERSQFPVDLITTSEFVDATDLEQTFRVDELLQLFLGLGGGGQQFIFIDACRLPASVAPMSGGQTGLNLTPSRTGRPSYYLLQSTAPGDVAVANGALGGPFTQALVEALSGKGKAKQWKGNKLVISFESICEFVQARLDGRQTLDPDTRGMGNSVLRELTPEKYPCTLNVKSARRTRVEVLISTSQSIEPVRRELGTGRNEVLLLPNSYIFQVASSGFSGTFSPPSPVDVFEPVELELSVTPKPRSLSGVGMVLINERFLELFSFPSSSSTPDIDANGLLDLDIPAGGSPRLISESDGSSVQMSARRQRGMPLPFGRYRAELEVEGRVVQSQTVEIKPGETTQVRLVPRAPNQPAARDLLARVPGSHGEGVADFSESLGPIAGDDFSTWLAVTAGGLLVEPRGSYSKLGALPFESFESLGMDKAALYVLTVGDDTAPEVRVHSRSGWSGLSAKATHVEDLTRVWHCPIEGARTDSLVSITRAGVRLSLAPPFLPGRVTLLILDGTSLRDMDVLCLTLPTSRVPADIVAREHALLISEGNPLRGILKLARAEHDFATWRGEHLRKLLAQPIDPVVGPMLCHFQIALGEPDAAQRTLRSLEKVQGETRDILALKHFLGLQLQSKPSVSLWLDGALALSPGANLSRLSPVVDGARLLLRGPWALWLG